MRSLSGTFVLTVGPLFLLASIARAQPPGGGGGPEPALSKQADVDDLVSRMLAFDQNKDGKLTRIEITDGRLHHLFDRADADKDGLVTRDELTALANKEHAESRGFGFGPPPGGGPGGPMMGGFPRPGEILSPMFQQRLKLTDAQKSELNALQKDVDARLETILNDEQGKQFKEMRERGPGGFGPPGGRGRPGNGGGPPPPPNRLR